MKLNTIVGILAIVIVWSCTQLKPKNENSNTQQLKFKYELKIENGTNRGTSYTDSKGTDYIIRYIPITVTNTDSVPIRIQLDFSEEYSSLKGSNNNKVLILPEVFALDGITLTTKNQILIDSMQIELRKYLEKKLSDPYQLDKILQPNENILIAVGIQYKPNQSVPSPLPNELFFQSEISNYTECNNLNNYAGTSNSQMSLWLKLNFNQGRSNENCIIIPCGQISYLKKKIII
ncbi:hypothetical protein [Spongiivirga citrea]|uniref:Uncharacterized protein n=1 Tax=Spongiivirga citrea TaxID=1481457 RepID=A0A6M0CUV2_9FLAO|nr:hypothetical protein [Spongiivirga citrea]NER17560.1 hypothetical protein [Spongiivirga citrea]